MRKIEDYPLKNQAYGQPICTWQQERIQGVVLDAKKTLDGNFLQFASFYEKNPKTL